MASFQGGGALNVVPEDFYEQLRKYLATLGGPGGGVGAFESTLPDVRQLAGAPYEALLADPDLFDMTRAGYSAGPDGVPISPRQLQATLAKYTPQGIVNNAPRTAWI